eukprot:comp12483_c0_seq1/m.16386 comp12483_c0_seq1/g.16386  ORF comp12483_c0_seq1/g.16386 comp12483_c0_seq1/m.16386 type:complete len:264 (-) comp12483_c0_seq1:24-815(-)
MQTLLRIGEMLMPASTESHYLDKGVLTPAEFVAAGDLLVTKCPSWKWEKGDRSHLPKDKQFLIIRNVPCRRRVRDPNDDENEVALEGGDDGGWTATHTTSEDLSKELSKASEPKTGADSDDDIPDIGDFSGGLVSDLSALSVSVVKTRTYDISITYDKYYQTPRMWLFGYDEARRPLKTEMIFEDISGDHANKTVTIEPHPHTGVSMASIHPCRHASVMKKFNDVARSHGKEIRVDQALFLFLKFMSALVPYIEYDTSASVEI